jgi:3-deoxy-D-arabino-heptulosonate 7-phosphate (DAHP) synthase
MADLSNNASVIPDGQTEVQQNVTTDVATDTKEVFGVIVKSKIRAGRMPALIQGE